MRCLYCGKELALLKRWTSNGEFCSDAHRQPYQEEYNQLALNRLLQAKPPGEAKPDSKAKAAEPKKPEEAKKPAEPERRPEERVSPPTTPAVPAKTAPAPKAAPKPPVEEPVRAPREPEPVVRQVVRP